MGCVKRLDIKFDIDRLRKEVHQLMDRFPLRHKQLGLTYRSGIEGLENQIYDSVGSLRKEGRDDQSVYRKYGMDSSFSTFISEKVFTNFIDEYKDSYFYEIYQTIGGLGRFRILAMQPKTCYSMHRDLTYRYHLAIDTNPGAYLVFPEQREFHKIPANGYVYRAKTTEMHTAINGSIDKVRIHIVMDDITENEY